MKWQGSQILLLLLFVSVQAFAALGVEPNPTLPPSPAPMEPAPVVPMAPKSTLSAAKPKAYRPKFFRPHEFIALKVLTETILRDDEMPGAREAKANEFIDFQIAYDPEIQGRFRQGLRWLDRHSQKLHGRAFVNLKPEQRREIIQCLEIKAKHRPGEERGREFFELARRYTYMGFYASEDALKASSHDITDNPKRARLAGASEKN